MSNCFSMDVDGRPQVFAVIPAAGEGRRIGRGAKSFLLLGGEPMLLVTARVFEASPCVTGIVVAAPPGEETRTERLLREGGIRKLARVVAGGAIRQKSVANALAALPEGEAVVAIHDAARPFLTGDLLEAVVDEAVRSGAALLAVPVKDTIKMVGRDGRVRTTPPREELWAAQTPQAFRLPLIRNAYREAARTGFVGTDDASLVERLGHPVTVVPGSYENMKITTPEDLLVAERILEKMTP